MNRAVQPILGAANEVAVPVVVLGECRYGIQSRERTRYERWLAETLLHFQALPVDENTAERYAEIRHELKRMGHPIPANDLWIAALVRQYRMPLLSRDQHFDPVPGIKRIGW